MMFLSKTEKRNETEKVNPVNSWLSSKLSEQTSFVLQS